MFVYIFMALHILVCVFLILVILLQQGKGQDLASAFGGAGSQTAFGARGTATLLSKITAGAAALFMVTSLALTYLRPAVGERTLVPDTPATEGATTPPPPAEQGETPPSPEGTETEPGTPEPPPSGSQGEGPTTSTVPDQPPQQQEPPQP